MAIPQLFQTADTSASLASPRNAEEAKQTKLELRYNLVCLDIVGVIMKSWQLQDAKARFSQLVRSAQTQGPQEVSLHGKPAAVVLSIEDYRRLAPRKPSFVELLRSSPLVGAELKLVRSKDRVRPVKL